MTDTTASSLRTEFVGTKAPLFRIALKTSVLTVLTLGFYRFWMKTRLRRWYWSAIRPGGLPMEYVGDPLEKLLGFFMVVVIMAFYIGIVNLILMFASLSLFASNITAYATSLIGLIPLWFYGRYRARRYVLARTRWRGVRFGLLPGAWGYAARALWHWSLTLLSLGLLWPRKTFYLEKYTTDRTVYGSAQLHQGGTWTMLLPAFVHVAIPAIIMASATYWLVEGLVGASLLYVIAVPWFILGVIHYSVESTRLLANHKTAGDISLEATPRYGTLLRVYGFGYLATCMVIALPLLPILTVIGAVEAERFRAQIGQGGEALMIYGLPVIVWTILGVIAYFAVLLMWSVLRHCFVTMPVWRHYAQTLVIVNADQLAQISQKQRDDFAEAEGFAEALDLWGAI